VGRGAFTTAPVSQHVASQPVLRRLPWIRSSSPVPASPPQASENASASAAAEIPKAAAKTEVKNGEPEAPENSEHPGADGSAVGIHLRAIKDEPLVA